MMSRIMISRNTSRRPHTADAFTLIELVIVLVIIAAMVTVTVPYATRSSEGLKLEQACLDIAEAIKYAMSWTTDTGVCTRLTIDVATGLYLIETATAGDGREFEPLEDSRAGIRGVGRRIRIGDLDGFVMSEQNRYCLLLDPGRPWPDASCSLAVKDAVKVVRIAGKAVYIEDISN